MTIITDNSPLSALAEIGHLEVLRELFGIVIVPETVARESTHPRAPMLLRSFMQNPPSWIQIVADPILLPETAALDPDESAAISLAWIRLPDVLLIVDDLPARHLSAALGIKHIGTAGLLLNAAQRGLIDFELSMAKLQATRFRLGSRIVDELRARFGAGRS
jgi:predicted nucleic acid-binding protein